MKKYLPWIIGLVLLAAFIAILPFSVTVVPIAEVEAQQLSEQFDPVAYVDGIWASQIAPLVAERAVDLAAILTQIEVDDSGKAKKEQLTAIAEENGLITVGEAHVYLVKGEGVVTAVDSESRTGALTVQLDGYDGPIAVKLYSGPRIPSDETSLRDGWALSTLATSAIRPSMARSPRRSTSASSARCWGSWIQLHWPANGLPLAARWVCAPSI